MKIEKIGNDLLVVEGYKCVHCNQIFDDFNVAVQHIDYYCEKSPKAIRQRQELYKKTQKELKQRQLEETFSLQHGFDSYGSLNGIKGENHDF